MGEAANQIVNGFARVADEKQFSRGGKDVMNSTAAAIRSAVEKDLRVKA